MKIGDKYKWRGTVSVIQPDEIPGELREIAKRMRAVSEPLIYFGGFGARGDLGRALEAQAPILSTWADLMEASK